MAIWTAACWLFVTWGFVEYLFSVVTTWIRSSITAS